MGTGRENTCGWETYFGLDGVREDLPEKEEALKEGLKPEEWEASQYYGKKVTDSIFFKR